MIAPQHPDQSQRLKALEAYHILDTEPEKAFDEVVNLVASLCEAPVALISFVERDRQWFKARHGLELTGTTIAQSICSYTILEPDLLVIEDTLADPRTADNPLCQGPDGVRFYAGAPLLTQDGLPVGTLCVLDYTPRTLSAAQRQALMVMANQVVAQLDLRQALRTAETLRREIDHRVKNSLQSLSALARYEARRVKGDEARVSLERMSRRVASVAVVHEQLFLTGAGEMVAADVYLANLARHLSEIAPTGVKVVGAAEQVLLTSADASLVGTLFNEAAANAFKHAFPDGRTGTVSYALEQVEAGRMRFTCQDDGIGLAAEGGRAQHGLGTMLGEAISLELEGLLEVEELDPGLAIRMNFTPQAPKSAVE